MGYLKPIEQCKNSKQSLGNGIKVSNERTDKQSGGQTK